MTLFAWICITSKLISSSGALFYQNLIFNFGHKTFLFINLMTFIEHRCYTTPMLESSILMISYCYRIRGGIKLFLGNFGSSLQDFYIAADLNEGEPCTLQERALVKCMLAKFPEASKDLVTAMAINPTLKDFDEIFNVLYELLEEEFTLVRKNDFPHPSSSNLQSNQLHQDKLHQLVHTM